MPSRKADRAPDSLESLISVVKNQRVNLNADLARLYGVPTKRFNEAFKRNQQQSPGEFAFQLTVRRI